MGDSFKKLDIVAGDHKLTYKQLSKDASDDTAAQFDIKPRFKDQDAMFEKLADWLEKPTSDKKDPLRALFARSVAVEWVDLGKCNDIQTYKIATDPESKR